jgi:hypothetical protein
MKHVVGHGRIKKNLGSVGLFIGVQHYNFEI